DSPATHTNPRSGRNNHDVGSIGDMGALGPSVHALPFTVGHSRPGRRVTGWPAAQRVAARQPVFGSRARVPMCGRRVRGAGATAGRAAAANTRATQVRVREGVQHASNTDETAFPGTPWHGC